VTRIALISAVTALVAASCAGGGDDRLSKPEYEATVRSAYAEVQEAFRRTDVAVGELPDRIEDAQAQLRDAAGVLEDVEPPEEVEAANDQVASAMRQYADDLDVLRAAAERGDEAAIESFNSRIAHNAAIQLLMEAAESMRAKGYDVGPIAEE
jgi:hypothetical protein